MVIIKAKTWSSYIVYICLILLIVFGGQYVFKAIELNARATYNTHPYLTNTLMIVFYGGTGILLGLEYFLNEAKKEGRWKINLPKMMLFGIPSLYFSLAIFIYIISNPIIHNTLVYPISVLINSDARFIPTFQLILGYSIITSFYKSK